MITVLYFLVMIYSLIAAPEVFFRLFKYKDSPEYEFFYLFGCLLMGFTLIAAAARIVFLIKDKVNFNE